MKDVTNTEMIYLVPKVKVLEIAARSILCGSLTGNGPAGIEDLEGEDNLDW